MSAGDRTRRGGSPGAGAPDPTRRSLLTAAGAVGGAAAVALISPEAALAAGGLRPTSITPSDYTAGVNEFVPVDASGGSVKITLPNAPGDGSQVGVRTVAFSAGHAVTVACSGSDKFNDSALGVTSLSLSSVDTSVLLQYQASTGTWYALSGGPSLAGASRAAGLSARTLVEAGRLVVINEALNACDAGYLAQGSSADQHEGIQSFLNAIGNAIGGNGGRGFIPPGVYHMGNAQLTFSTPPCVIEGEGGGDAGWFPWEPGPGTVLRWGSDIVAAPHTAYAITVGASGRPQGLKNMQLVGPTPYAPQVGGLPCALGGVNACGSAALDRLSINNFSSGVGWGGPGRSFDHGISDRVVSQQCGYGYDLLSGSNGAGDFHHSKLRLSATLAAIGVAQSASSGFGGASISESTLYGPFSLYRYSDGSGLRGNFIDSSSFLAVSAEGVSHAVAYDELWQSGTQGGIVVNSFFAPLGAGYNTPGNNGSVWSKSLSVSGSSGTQITVTDGSGFVFRPGMTVTGTGVPANTIVTSVAGSWPWASATLTLNNRVGNPTSVVISQPNIATIVAYTIENNDFYGVWEPPTVAYPMLAARTIYNNRHTDGRGAYIVALNNSLTKGSFVAGNSWGRRDALVSLGSAFAAGSMAQGDVVMKRAGYNGHVVLCDGSRRPIGTVVRTVNGAQTVDYVIAGCSDEGITPYGHNRGDSSIAANALVFVDAAHPGGITATPPTSGWAQPIGVNGGSAIAPGAIAPLRELWC